MKPIDAHIEDYRNVRLEPRVLAGLLPRLRPHLRELSFCAILLAGFSLLSLIGPLLVRHAIDVDFAQRSVPGLLRTAGLYFAVVLASFGISYWQRVRLEIVGQKIIRGLRADVFGHLVRLPQSFFDRNPVGRLLSRVESDTEALREMFTFTVITVLSDLIMVGGIFVVMVIVDWRLALLMGLAVPLVIFTVRAFNRRIVPFYLETRRRTAEVYAFLEEYIRGVAVVQAFNQERGAAGRMNAVNRDKAGTEYPAERLSVYFGHTVFLISSLASAAVLGAGGWWVLQGALTLGSLVMFLDYIQRFFGPIFHLSEQMNVIQRAFSGARRIEEILATPLQTHLPGGPAAIWPLRRSIEFDHVWFAYHDEEWVLRDVSFELPRGRRVALVGPTGGGKTTIASLLFRFYDPQRGAIRIDGVDIRQLPLALLRERMALVLQDIILFPTDVLENLRLDDPGVSESRVLAALETVQARDLVERLPAGLACPLSEGGLNLSTGERQLLSFARALVIEPDVLVLDEATSAVDPLTEKRVQAAMARLLGSRTALVVAHRLQTILDCDEILVVRGGEIVERGSHEELLARRGAYWHLHQLQFGVPAEADR